MDGRRLLGIMSFSGCLVFATGVSLARAPLTCAMTASSQPPAFVAPAPYSANAPFQRHFWYGSEALWTMLREDGQWGAVYLPEQRVYRNKVFVWRADYDARVEPRPALVLTAKRLDAEAPPVTVADASHASAPDIGTAMLTAMNLPAAGCWELTARYAHQALTFVVSVP